LEEEWNGFEKWSPDLKFYQLLCIEEGKERKKGKTKSPFFLLVILSI
jgi:hypothetical protein